MNIINKCKIVNILTEAQYIEIYDRIKNKQIEAYNKYMEKTKHKTTRIEVLGKSLGRRCPKPNSDSVE